MIASIEDPAVIERIREHLGGEGKSGGVRVIYYFYDQDMPIYALLVYDKNERADLTAKQRKAVAAFAEAIKLRGNENEQAW